MTSYDLPCVDVVVQIRTSAKEIVAHCLVVSLAKPGRQCLRRFEPGGEVGQWFVIGRRKELF